jgi:hypothetical protein
MLKKRLFFGTFFVLMDCKCWPKVLDLESLQSKNGSVRRAHRANLYAYPFLKEFSHFFFPTYLPTQTLFEPFTTILVFFVSNQTKEITLNNLSKQFLATDILALVSMKTAAKCDT